MVHTTTVVVPDSKQNSQSAKKAQAVMVAQISDKNFACFLAKSSTPHQNSRRELGKPTDLYFPSPTKAMEAGLAVAELFCNSLAEAFACELNCVSFRQSSQLARSDETAHTAFEGFVSFAEVTQKRKRCGDCFSENGLNKRGGFNWYLKLCHFVLHTEALITQVYK